MYEANVDVNIVGINITLDAYRKYIVNGKVHITISKPKTEKTLQQLRAVHSLLTAFFLSGMHSAPDWVVSADLFKLYCKISFGVCFDVVKDGVSIRVPKSFSDYTKVEQMEFIDALISTIEQAGASGEKKINEILTGMKENDLY